MSEGKPEIQEGYLGEQPKFGELQLEVVSHPQAEFSLAQDNEVEIKIRSPTPIKSTTNLIQARTEKEFPEYVFTQTQGNTVTFVISFPEHGWYKFQIFALPTSDESKSLPNVFNYLIDVRRALKAVYPFPKQYAPWRDGCYLHCPLVLNSSSRLANVTFRAQVPRAKQLAIVAAGEWFPLKKGAGEVWEGNASLDKHRSKNVKVTLNACFGEDDSKFATLLEWVV